MLLIRNTIENSALTLLIRFNFVQMLFNGNLTENEYVCRHEIWVYLPSMSCNPSLRPTYYMFTFICSKLFQQFYPFTFCINFYITFCVRVGIISSILHRHPNTRVFWEILCCFRFLTETWKRSVFVKFFARKFEVQAVARRNSTFRMLSISNDSWRVVTAVHIIHSNCM